MAQVLKIFAILFMLSAVIIVFDAMKVSSLYPFGQIKMFNAHLKSYQSENRVPDAREFDRITQEYDCIQKQFQTYYRKATGFEAFCLLSSLVASVLFFIASHRIAKHATQKQLSIPQDKKHES